MNTIHLKKYCTGVSLIELMIALLIGILLLAGTASLFISNKRIYKDQNEMSRLQENARFAMEMLIKDIRMAGYSGCMDRIGDITNHVNGSINDDTLLNFGNAVEGSESGANWQPSDSTQATPGNPVDGSAANDVATISMDPASDAISVKYLAPLGDRIGDITNHVNGSVNDDTLLNFGNAVEGSESGANWQPSGSTQATPGNPVDGSAANDVATISMDPDSDAISVKYLAPLDISLSDEMPNVSAELKVTTVGDLAIGELIALSDCDSADIMQLTNVQTLAGTGHLQHNAGGALTPGNATQTLSKVYSTDAEVLRLTTLRYFVGTSDTTGEPALFRYTLDRQDFDNDGDTTEFVAQEMIESVENMQILFGEDTAGADTIADTYVDAGTVTNWDNVADTYVDAATVTNWDNVVSVRIALLMRTVEEDFSTELNTNTYDLLGTNFDPTPDDHRRRRVFTNTIQVRNRSN